MGFVGAGGDAFNFGGGHEVGSAKCRGADEDFSGFGGHQGCGENGVGSRTERDQAVILKEDEARSGVVFFYVGFGAMANLAREGGGGIAVHWAGARNGAAGGGQATIGLAPWGRPN